MRNNHKTGRQKSNKTGKRENKICLPFTFYLIPFMFIALICLSSAAGQNNIGKIEGQIIDKRKNVPLSQQQVILHIHRAEEPQQRETVTDENGLYVFDDLSLVFDVHYAVSTTYEGREHFEGDLVLSEWVPELKVNIEIGAFTDDRSKVEIRQHTVVISPPPADHLGVVSVMEVVRVENTGDLAFQASMGNQEVGLYFNLPPGYEQLQLDRIFKGDLVTGANQLISNQPLPPGELSAGYSYLIHIGSGLDLSRKLTFDTDQLYVFIADGMPLAPQTSILGAGRKEQIHDGMAYTVYATNPSKPLSAGQTANLQFKTVSVALAPRGRTGPPSDSKMIALIAIAAACAGGFLVAAIFKVRAPTAQHDELETPESAPDASWLRKLELADLDRTRIARLEMITRLEEMHEKHEISDRVYDRLHKEQADRLTAVLERIQR